MMGVLEELLRALRPAFTRQATFAWFVVAFAGVVTRQDVYGVISIIRALRLAPVYYPALLHFFHS
ncbi:MAG: transposase, partial [Lentisphaerales bacterium]